MRASTLYGMYVFVMLNFPVIVEAQNLQDTWEVGKSYVGTDEKKFKIPDDPRYNHLRPVSEVTKNTIALVNRGLVVTKQPIPENQQMFVSFNWSWVEGRESDRYPDHLVVALYTTGTQRQNWSHEVVDGVVVRFDPTEKQMSIQHHQKGDEFKPKLLAAKDMEFKRFESYQVTISEREGKIYVVLNGQRMLEASVPPVTFGRKIALYNREPVAGVRHVSLLSNVELSVAK